MNFPKSMTQQTVDPGNSENTKQENIKKLHLKYPIQTTENQKEKLKSKTRVE